MHRNDQDRRCFREKCPPPEDVVAWVCDAAAPRNSRWAAHFARCPACRRLAEEVRSVRARVMETRESRTDPDLLPGVMSRVRAESAVSSRRRSPRRARHRETEWSGGLLRLAAAAGILLALGLGGMFFLRRSAPASPPPEAGTDGAEWLLRRQSAQGDWPVGQFGGREEFAPALNGLSLLALIGHGEDSEVWDRAIRKGARALLRFQSPESGQFGKDGYGSLYNHGIATLALLSACARFGEAEELEAAARSAVQFILATQADDGGWGYGTSGRSGRPSDPSITAWQVQALTLARQLGRREVEPSLRRGLAWMGRRMRGAEMFGYRRPANGDISEEDTLAKIMSAYCVLLAPPEQARGGERLVEEATVRLEALRETLPGDYYEAFFYAAARHLVDADEKRSALAKGSGAMPVVLLENGADRWSPVGGRLYREAMTALVRTPLKL